MSGGVLEPGSCRTGTAIIQICNCVCVMRFLVFLSGLDTAQSTAFIITHASNITTKYKKQNILNTVFVLRVRALVSSIMRYPVSMSHLLECSSESLSCMLVANPINLFSGRRSAPSDFSLPLFFLFFLRSAMIMIYLTDIPSAFVMHSSDTAGRLPAANSAIASTMMFVLARHKIAHAHLFKGLKDTRREEFTIKQNGPDVTAHAAAYCNQVAHKITHVLKDPSHVQDSEHKTRSAINTLYRDISLKCSCTVLSS